MNNPHQELPKKTTDEKYLIILDVNGLLCQKLHPLSTNDATIFPDNHGNSYFRMNQYRVYPRPRAKKFIQRLLGQYKVAIFSSTTAKNLNPILERILGSKIISKLYFVWDRSRTHFDPNYSSFNTIKLLSDFWQNPVYNKNRYWNEKNTICIDHHFQKLRKNPLRSVLICQEWQPENENSGKPSKYNGQMATYASNYPETFEDIELAIHYRLNVESYEISWNF